jgi:glucose/arabinose dehydrogenase
MSVSLLFVAVACNGGTPVTTKRGLDTPQSTPTATTQAAMTPPTPAPNELTRTLVLVEVVRGLEAPVDVEVAPSDTSGRLYVVEKVGRIRIVEGGEIQARPMLDFTDRVSGSNEQGLLGLAFHPSFASNGRLYVNYTDLEGSTHVTELRVDSKDRDRIDVSTARDLIVLAQPYANHNGGHLTFGPDGKLWVGMGDGGAGGDPRGAGQDDDTLLGKLVRIDVDAAEPTTEPIREPIPEIVAKGLRNPWRFTFDPITKDLFVADVGQNQWEEISVVSGVEAQRGGLNFGWKIMEGTHCYEAEACETNGLVVPVVEYGHGPETGCSITGGEVVRGAANPALDGAYFYSDFCSGALRSFRWRDGRVTDHWDWKPALDPGGELKLIASFSRDSNGDLLLVSLEGSIWRLTWR